MHTRDQTCSTASNSTAQVDANCPDRDEYEVVVCEDEALSAYMTWSDTHTNQSRFYIAQILQKKGQTGLCHKAFVYTRWSREGTRNGQKSLKEFEYFSAIKTFIKVTQKKQKNVYTAIKITN